MRDKTMADSMLLDPSTLRKFRQVASTYSSYPIADRFVEAFDAPTLEQWIAAGKAFGLHHGCALAIRFPSAMRALFEGTLDERASNNHSWYLHHLEKEIRMVGSLIANHVVIENMHWSGSAGTLSDVGQASLLDVLRDNFEFSRHGAHSADINPFNAALSDLSMLRQAGVTRVEICTQDLALFPADKVHWAERQIKTAKLVTVAREVGMVSIGADLIVGAAGQSTIAFMDALETLLACTPDRVTLRECRLTTENSLAQHQSARFEMLIAGAQSLADAGYTCIGIDHFVRLGDSLAVAQRLGRLTRLPHGYSPSPCDTVFALGPGAIGVNGPTYYQNHRTADDYCSSLDQGRLPIMRGLQLTPDDLARRTIIHSLSTNLFVDIAVIETVHHLDFHAYFAVELLELAQFEAAGLLCLRDSMITVRNHGYLVLGAICAVFDGYNRQARLRAPYLVKP